VANALEIKVAEARRLRDFVIDFSPLDTSPSADEEADRGLPESFQPRHTDKAIEQIELDQQTEELLKQISDRERNILRYRYGLVDGKAHTLEETGAQFSLTRERIRQIERDSMNRLREFVAQHTADFKP